MTTPADELRAAAATLRAVAPEITGRLAGLAGPVADWLDETAWIAEPIGPINARALAVARAVNGSQP